MMERKVGREERGKYKRSNRGRSCVTGGCRNKGDGRGSYDLVQKNIFFKIDKQEGNRKVIELLPGTKQEAEKCLSKRRR